MNQIKAQMNRLNNQSKRLRRAREVKIFVNRERENVEGWVEFMKTLGFLQIEEIRLNSFDDNLWQAKVERWKVQ